MKNYFLFVLLLSGIVCAQITGVADVEKVIEGNGNNYFHAQFTPDDNSLILSSSNYIGLWSYNFNDNNVNQLTEEVSAGYNFQFSDNGNSIIYKSDSYINKRKYSSIVEMNLSNKEKQILVDAKRGVSAPIKIGKTVTFLTNDKLANSDVALEKNGTFVYQVNTTIILQRNGSEVEYKPLGNGHYLWASLSPDETKVLFTFAGKGTFVCDLEGNVITQLGNANFPKWSPDGKYILFMNDKDNGDRVTASDIFVVQTDGNVKINITSTDDTVELYPSWSNDGKSIVFSDAQGSVYVAKLETAE